MSTSFSDCSFPELRELYASYKRMLPELLEGYKGKWIGLSYNDKNKMVIGDSRAEVMNHFQHVSGPILVQEIQEHLKIYEV